MNLRLPTQRPIPGAWEAPGAPVEGGRQEWGRATEMAVGGPLAASGEVDPPDLGVGRVPLTETEAFRRWFGASKVRDEDGHPLVVYHATCADFEAFQTGGGDQGVSGAAIWFTDRSDHQPNAHNRRSSGARVIPAFLKIERPLLIDDRISLEWAREVFANGSLEFPQLLPERWAEKVRENREYDGIIFRGEDLGWGKGTNEYIVFQPTQVKSALGNGGAFDPSDPRITT